MFHDRLGASVPELVYGRLTLPARDQPPLSNFGSSASLKLFQLSGLFATLFQLQTTSS